VGAMKAATRLVKLGDVDPIPLPHGSWSRMLLTDKTVPGSRGSLGYSVFEPGTVLAAVSHEVEELAYVVAGQGELRLEEESLAFQAGDALYIPAHTWHAVANTGETPVLMVFTFPYPDYPPTARR
jgi:quercetin dioxygenase-like cupin family protein